ncbi:hypothetical protein [Rhodoplanes roseus]|uniref:Uncharacterized protein n=1 Tax=Rhodoplanes roseus TaxID=29409 RepID=A0A327L1W7_9BRAD|nr:hypothetical protein [Rhodoplanes roseus]RAI44486.1 hypothetical protein CH341_08890 [Rhodoplanes roseus]
MLTAIIVNDREPRSELDCSVCGKKIGQGYTRDLGTRIMYDCFRCFSIDEVATEVVLDADDKKRAARS